MRRFQQTRDLKPLISEFFVDDFPTCMYESMLRDPDNTDKSVLSTTDVIRGYIAAINIWHIHMTVFIYDHDTSRASDYDSLVSVFPARIAKELNSFGGIPELLTNDDFAHRDIYLEKLVRAERAASEARRYMRRKNIEGSAKYLRELRKYESSDWLGYIVSSRTDKDFAPCKSDKMNLQAGTRIFSVTTPIWLVPAFVKVGNRFRIRFLDIYDD